MAVDLIVTKYAVAVVTTTTINHACRRLHFGFEVKLIWCTMFTWLCWVICPLSPWLVPPMEKSWASMENPGFCNWNRGQFNASHLGIWDAAYIYMHSDQWYKGFSLLFIATLLNQAWQRFVLLLACSIVVSQKCDTQSAQEALLVITITHFLWSKANLLVLCPSRHTSLETSGVSLQWSRSILQTTTWVRVWGITLYALNPGSMTVRVA